MRTLLVTCLAAVVAPALLSAGAIFGSIFFNGAAVKGGEITIACGAQNVKGATLDDGSYRITAPEGKCTFTVTGQPFGTASTEVVSATSAARYTFEVVKVGNAYELRRQ